MVDIQEPSYLLFLFQSLGMKWIVYLAVGSAFSVAVIALASIRWRNPASAVLLLMSVSLPLVLGTLCFASGIIEGYQVIANSPTQLKPNEFATAYSMSLVGLLIGTWLTILNFLFATVACVIRLFTNEAVVAKVTSCQP